MWERVEVYKAPWDNEYEEWIECSFAIESGTLIINDANKMKASYAPGTWTRVYGWDEQYVWNHHFHDRGVRTCFAYVQDTSTAHC